MLEALAARGITIEQLAEATKQMDADPLDLLIHVAWRGPLRTRRDRAERARQEGRAFFEQFAEKARQVLNDLIEKYTEHGVNELDDLHVLEVPPISRHGTVVEIAQAFGGADRLKAAVQELQRLLYVA
jgi:type I restriction enzyme R subunit